MKLNLGSGNNKRQGYVNIDQEPLVEPDICQDLEQVPWRHLALVDSPYRHAIEANSVDEILAHHVLEHLGQTPDVFLNVMKEIYRVLTPGGTVEIKVPHHHSDNFWSDPTHVRPITPQGLMLFSKRCCAEAKAKGWPNTPLAEYYDIDLELVSTNFALTPYWAKQYNDAKITKTELDFAMATYWNVVDEVTMVLRKVDSA